jgi:hypothetical protein
MHDGLRRARSQAIGTIAIGATLALLFACGPRRRRLAHGPFAFSEYNVFDWRACSTNSCSASRPPMAEFRTPNAG